MWPLVPHLTCWSENLDTCELHIIAPPKLTCYLEIPNLPFCFFYFYFAKSVFLGYVLNESIYFVVDHLYIYLCI